MVGTLQNKLEQALAELEIFPLGQALVPENATFDWSNAECPVIRLEVGFPCSRSAAQLTTEIAEALGAAAGGRVSVQLESNIRAHAVQGTLTPLDNVSNIIAVSSAKGGVGKSTVAANLALALSAEGAKVGILDADIYGPSQPIMLGVAGQQPVSQDGKTFEPLTAHNLAMISIGCLIDTEQPTVWRGPMVTQALNQLLFQTNWPELDYLIVDMPPGTGDIQLTLSQRVPVSGAVIVTTPQDIALADAIRGLRMFEKVRIPVLGLVENMSSFVCPSCGEITSLFGHGGGAQAAENNQLKLLGQLPLDISIRESTDAGKPSVIADPESAVSNAFSHMALATAAELARRPRDYSRTFGSVKVEPS